MQNHDDHVKQETDRIGIEDYAELLDEAKEWKPAIQMTGGEPFMYRQIDDLLKLVKDRHLFCMINTNGTMLQRHAETIVSLGVEKLTVSIDGPPGVHNCIRGSDRAYDQAMAGIEALAREKARQRSAYPFIDVKSVITPANAGKLEPVVQLLDSGWIQMVDFVHMWFLHESQTRLHDKLNTGVPYYPPHSFPLFARDELKYAMKHIRDLQRRYKHRPFIVFPDIPDESMMFYYDEPSRPLYRNRCGYPYETARVLPNGDILACPEDIAAKAILGNLREESFTDIVRGQRACEFLKKLDAVDGAWPICTRCCGMFRS